MRNVCKMGYRERHAKTLEIAQEEVLTCLGVCMAERLYKVHRRLREEETVCKVLAAVAIDALSRNFQVMFIGKTLITEYNAGIISARSFFVTIDFCAPGNRMFCRRRRSR